MAESSDENVEVPTGTAEVDPAAPVVDEEPNTSGDALTAERDQYRDMAQRLQAEFENYRKRTAREVSESGARANEKFARELLTVLDTIDLALAHDTNESLEQVRGTLVNVLGKEGLERIDAVDQPFDPEQHEAVAHEPGDGEPRVSEDLRAGYKWKGRVIRPSMVKVSGS